MARFHCHALQLFAFVNFFVFTFSFSTPSKDSDHEYLVTDLDWELFHQDYSPPAPPPPPPHPPSVSCVDDLDGVGSLDTACQIVSDLNLTRDVYIAGRGSFYILPGVKFQCLSPGCMITVDVGGNFSLGSNSSIIGGTIWLVADNVSFGNDSVVNTTGMAGDPPPQTSGTPQGIDGAGGGYGGRGACCLWDKTKIPEDVWGGDAYSWSSTQKPLSYGSKGGSRSTEHDFGGLGGGIVHLTINQFLQVNGSVLADGGNGGEQGGGGSGGSIYIHAHKMTGIGRISACGGNGFAGGGGGRVSVDIFSRHDDPKIFVYGGDSLGCQENAGAAGTLYDAVPRSLTVDNNNKSTDTETLLLEFPYQPLWTNIYVRNNARALVPLLWSRVQVQGQISLSLGGILSFGLQHYASSEFELLAEELLMSNSEIRVYGALRMSVKMLLMWKSKLVIDGGGDTSVATSLLEASNLIVLKESSVIHSSANLGVQGQGLLNLSGPGDGVEAQRLALSLFYSINVGPGSFLRGPLENAITDDLTPKLGCETEDCPVELLYPPNDCNINSSLSFTLQVCRVEDIIVEGLIKGSVVHFHRARTLTVESSGKITASGMGCTGGVGQGKMLNNIVGTGAGHGGRGGGACFNDTCIEGGISYGNADLPCELGSGSGNGTSSNSTKGGGIIVVGSLEHPLSSFSIQGSVRADGESFEGDKLKKLAIVDDLVDGPGGASGGTLLLFLRNLNLGESASLSSKGGGSFKSGGGGGGGRIHFHWSNIPTGDVYQPIAVVKGTIHAGGGISRNSSGAGENGTVTGKACPKGLYGTFCEQCPPGTYKNLTGSDKTLCFRCPPAELPNRATYVDVRGGVAETPCPYVCVSERYHMPYCYTALEELIHTFGGPWLFGLFLLGLLILLALVLSVARMKFVGVEESPGLAPTQHGSQIDHSFPFLESLNEVLETSRVEESQSHVHRMYFRGPNTFSEPWHLPHTPPEQIKDIVYEGAFSTFVDDINGIAAYQWWEGATYSILSLLAYPVAWSWKQWRRRMKLQRLREFVRSEYDHACLRSCRSRALYEGIKVAATSDLMLAYVDFFLGGDEKRPDLPPRLHQRLPMSLIFGGDGSYMAPFSLSNDNILNNLMSQSVPPTKWFRLVSGLNAQLRLVCRGRLRMSFRFLLKWIEVFANPGLKSHGIHVDLACFQDTASGYYKYGLLVYAVDEENSPTSLRNKDETVRTLKSSWEGDFTREFPSDLYRDGAHLNLSERIGDDYMKRRAYGAIIDVNSLKTLEERRDIFYLLSFVLHNTKPVGHKDLVGLVISVLLLGDFSLVLLTLFQLYSISLADVFLVLFILPFAILVPFPAGINALFSHGPRRSAGLARVYAMWNLTSLVNVVVAFLCGYFHYFTQSSGKRHPASQPWTISMDESEWWIFPAGLILCKLFQSRLINWHITNLEIQDRSVYGYDFELFWQS